MASLSVDPWQEVGCHTAGHTLDMMIQQGAATGGQGAATRGGGGVFRVGEQELFDPGQSQVKIKGKQQVRLAFDSSPPPPRWRLSLLTHLSWERLGRKMIGKLST